MPLIGQSMLGYQWRYLKICLWTPVSSQPRVRDEWITSPSLPKDSYHCLFHSRFVSQARKCLPLLGSVPVYLLSHRERRAAHSLRARREGLRYSTVILLRRSDWKLCIIRLHAPVSRLCIRAHVLELEFHGGQLFDYLTTFDGIDGGVTWTLQIRDWSRYVGYESRWSTWLVYEDGRQ